MIEISEHLSNRFKNMALVCAFLVTLIHCILFFRVNCSFLHFAIEDGVCRIAVPFFFFASGFFLYGHVLEAGWWRRELAKRVRTLLIPYVIWISLLAIPVFCFSPNLSGGSHLAWIATAYGLNPLHHPLLNPVWYIRALFVIVILSPILVFLINRLGVWTLVVVGALYGLLGPWEGLDGPVHYFFRKTIATQGMFYVTLGMLFRSGRLNVVVSGSGGGKMIVLGGLLIVLKVILQYHVVWFYYYCGWLAIPFLMLGVFNAVPDRAWPRWCTDCAFPIYLVHLFFIRLFILLGLRMFPNEGVKDHLFTWFCFTLAVCILSFLSIVFQRRLFPKLNTLFYGGR